MNTLYTEEQVSLAINVAKANPEQAYLILAMLKPIELPSNQEIEDRIGFEYPATYQNAFKEGAKWMRDKISGGNK